MPYHYRFFIDREILEKPNKKGILGGDHIRVIDIEADESGLLGAEQLVLAELKPYEVIGSRSLVTLDETFVPEVPV